MNANEIYAHIASEMESCSGRWSIPSSTMLSRFLSGAENWTPLPEDKYDPIVAHATPPIPAFSSRYPLVIYDSHLYVYITPLNAGFHASYFKFRKER